MEHVPYVGLERRRFVRMRMPCTLRYQFEGYDWDLTSTRNISAGGLLFTVPSVPVDAHMLNCIVQIATHPEIHVRARVIRVAQSIFAQADFKDVAAEFVSIDDVHRRFIDEHAQETETWDYPHA